MGPYASIGTALSILSIAALVALAGAASGTILTFEPHTGNHGDVAAGYGDNVATSPQAGLLYGVGAEGFTPNVIVDYGLGQGDINQWDTGYGDLSVVAIRDDDNNGHFLIQFTADAGFLVVLHDLDMAGWPNTDRAVTWIEVRDGGGAVLFHQDNLVAAGTGHTDVDFGGLTAQVLTLDVRLDLGGASDDVGLDNIRFGQVDEPAVPVPERGTLVLLAAGLVAIVGVVAVRRRLA